MMSWEEIIKVETYSRGFTRENLPESKKERLKDLKEELEMREKMLSSLETLESALLPLAGAYNIPNFLNLPKMEKRMKDMMDYVKPLIPHYKQLIEETEDSIKRIGE